MIRQLKGTVSYKDPEYIILDVNGIGYQIFISPNTLANISEKPTLWTHLAVRENSMDLYGFLEANELELFELLLGVSGIGPRGALAIISLDTVETLKNAIATNNFDYLTKVSGVGKKSAQKIILELKDKVGSTSDSSAMSDDSDVLDALTALGYSQTEARNALKKIPKNIENTENKIKEALKTLS